MTAWAGLTALTTLTACTLQRPTVPPTVEHDPTLPRLAAGGRLLHGQALGPQDAPVLVVLHGGPGADHRYLLGLSALADAYRVVFYDQTGSGLSPRLPAEALTVQHFVDDLDAVVQAQGGGRPVHLLGHSWGAMLATAYAGAHPDRVDRLVLAEPGFLEADTLDGLPGGGWPGWRVVLGFGRAWLAQWTVDPQGDPFARADWFLGQVFPLTQGEATHCPGSPPPLTLWRAGAPAFQATLGRMQRDPAWGRQLDFTHGLQAYSGRVLFVRGACNQAQGEAHQRRMMARFAPVNQARLETVPQAGHFMFNDQPQASLAAVRGFLAAP
ncbi:alpha/beta fold hydrolase [Ideonella livida]|uniref:Alpha/beta fold hydrolase n=1 Tax=Ideonella livida TaxID=2707176 RepID=A0A7C9TJ54_9BURK|nr:alpha/beta hydrolase [Ideonella livida]NDY90365.1 alpha/beta fold hydrolase [Ideonella livida]